MIIISQCLCLIVLSSYYSPETRKGLILCYKTVNNEYNNGETIQI